LKVKSETVDLARGNTIDIDNKLVQIRDKVSDKIQNEGENNLIWLCEQ
jgi:hypothetical protein